MLCTDVTGNVVFIHPIIYKRPENKCIPHRHKKIVIHNHHDKNHVLLVHNGGIDPMIFAFSTETWSKSMDIRLTQ